MATKQKRKPHGFKLLLHGELSYLEHPDTAWQLPSMNPGIEIDLEEAVRDPKAFDEAALLIGRHIMQRGVRYAARGAKRWHAAMSLPLPKKPNRHPSRSTQLARLARL